jgi:hypothetical protein
MTSTVVMVKHEKLKWHFFFNKRISSDHNERANQIPLFRVNNSGNISTLGQSAATY